VDIHVPVVDPSRCNARPCSDGSRILSYGGEGGEGGGWWNCIIERIEVFFYESRATTVRKFSVFGH